MTETTNLADDEKLSKLLKYVFKKESILTESEFKSKVKSLLDLALKSIQSESESESESELELESESELELESESESESELELESESESESELEKEEQPKYYSVKDEDIDIRNKLYEDNYINNK